MAPPAEELQDGYYPWKQPGKPGDEAKARLHVHNSLTGGLTPFIPVGGPDSNVIKAYICGPTVYDSAHMGHASTYVRFDIVKRILADYFGYDVVAQMNVTDIDDKIIEQSRRSGVPFEELAGKYEAEFFKDMTDLNVRPPHFVTRVSEYIPEIVAYVERIIENGYAYESQGSVYFDTAAFVKAGNKYAKVEPKSAGNIELLAGGEGSLTSADAEKRSQTDFVLWKKSREGEPKWPSPWSEGRPGWHTECSVMVHTVHGKSVDLHVGGVDLRFPHHSNEIAIAEAYYKSTQWVNYWLHSGHLHIEGLKMSKSLKNFIKIQEVLKRFSARQLRFTFLKYRYSAPINYDEKAMKEAVNLDKTFSTFFASLRSAVRSSEKLKGMRRKPRPSETSLVLELSSAQTSVAHALADDFNTPLAMQKLIQLVRSTNAYLKSVSDDSYNSLVLFAVGRYISKMLKVFGVIGSRAGELEYGEEGGSASLSREAVVGPILTALSEYRDSVRQKARKEARLPVCQAILKLSDGVRDEVLPSLGVRLEDRGGNRPSIWKLEDSKQ